ncbi:MAG: P-loop NTPase, partial [Gammaproteobacteria bacterium]|nr:P-loop NTPase [Gammaproteobacteria bacterium]
MSQMTNEEIKSALQKVVDENLEQDLITANAVKNIEQTADTIQISIELGYPLDGYIETLRQKILEVISSGTGNKFVNVDVTTNILSHAVQKSVKPLPGVKNTIAIASGKGGVGKSTTAVNLALALQAEGASVGILDADIYGPSQPRMLGCVHKPESKDGKKLEPNVSYGIQSMSIGYLIDEETPMIWRGPMVTSALEQLLGDTNWSELDY